MAAGIAARRLAAAKIDAKLSSMGILGIRGRPAEPLAVEAAKAVGVDLSRHRSQGISLPTLLSMDRIVALAPEHEDFLIGLEWCLSPRIDRLWTFSDPAEPLTTIADPLGRDLSAYVECRGKIDVCIARWVEEVIDRYARRHPNG